MTTEQKAKRFEELLTKAKQIYNKENDVLIIHTIEDLFPELKISEDEEIRKGLIQYFNDFNLDTFAGLDPKKILSWFEKQGQVKDFTISQHENKKCKENGNSLTSEDDRIRKALIEHFRWNTKQILNEFSNKKTLAWLDKQVESNPYSGVSFEYNGHTFGMCARDGGVEIAIDSELKAFVSLDKSIIFPIHHQSAREAIKEEKVDNQNCVKPVDNVEPTDYNSIDPHFGKPIDKVEPKFHEGDWTVSKLDRKARQISEVHFDEYNSYYVVNGKSVNLEEYDRLHHLWTIDDARDGDVLHSPSHHLIWIYKDNEHYYACVNMNYATKNVATNGLIIIPNDACPATKDEQTILFARMKEADYEWDAEKKEIGHKHFCELDNSCACVKFPFKAKVKSTGTIVAIHGGQLSPDGNEWIKYQSDAEDGYKIYEPNNLELVCDIEQ